MVTWSIASEPTLDQTLGDLEQLVMLALARLGDDAYGVAVRDVIEERTGRALAYAAIYTTLARLEAKGLVRSFLGEPTAERGGRAKKHFAISGAGRAALRRNLADLHTMTQGLGSSWTAS